MKLKRLGQNIRERRREKKLSQKVLAQRVMVDQGALSRIENGKKEPLLRHLYKLGQKLGVSVIDLLDGV